MRRLSVQLIENARKARDPNAPSQLRYRYTPNLPKLPAFAIIVSLPWVIGEASLRVLPLRGLEIAVRIPATVTATFLMKSRRFN